MLSDTDPKAERVLIEGLRAMPVWRKIEIMGQLSEMVRQLAFEGVRRRHPDADDAEVRRRLADIRLGHELARRAFGPAPWEEGTEDAA